MSILKMAPQPSSLRTSFRALSITRMEIKKSVIYDGRRQVLVEWEDRSQPEIGLNNSTVKPDRICWRENTIQGSRLGENVGSNINRATTKASERVWGELHYRSTSIGTRPKPTKHRHAPMFIDFHTLMSSQSY